MFQPFLIGNANGIQIPVFFNLALKNSNSLRIKLVIITIRNKIIINIPMFYQYYYYYYSYNNCCYYNNSYYFVIFFLAQQYWVKAGGVLTGASGVRSQVVLFCLFLFTYHYNSPAMILTTGASCAVRRHRQRGLRSGWGLSEIV